MKIPKREYTTEFKELAVKRVKDGQSPGAVAKELELVEQTLRNWVKAADAGTLSGPGIKQVTPEQMELSRLGAKGARLVAQKWPSSNYPACHAPSRRSSRSGVLLAHASASRVRPVCTDKPSSDQGAMGLSDQVREQQVAGAAGFGGALAGVKAAVLRAVILAISPCRGGIARMPSRFDHSFSWLANCPFPYAL
ncbi:MAG: transposase [Uliginosibacterium sp.]|nr:transposase [Uliginosibacterium sp.]